VAPHPPRRMLQSLPPILRVLHQNSVPGYSKGSRGLSVLSWEPGIFTGSTVSLSPPPRQRPDRYAIRAGRNLPDKEFRYLRTVIVTAAVYRGFDLELLPGCPRITPPLNLPAPGRRQALYVVFDLAEPCVFSKQSPGPFHCDSEMLQGRTLTQSGAHLLPKLRC
jgi:hypothetical protein